METTTAQRSPLPLISAIRILEAYKYTVPVRIEDGLDGVLYVTICGTKTSDDIMEDLQAKLVPLAIPGLEDDYAHDGFVDIMHKVLPQVITRLGSIKKIIITGHSLGGAVATLLAYVLAKNRPELDVQVHTFGSPRVCSRALATKYNAAVPKTVRVVLDRDIVPTLPFGRYQHVHHLMWLNHNGIVKKMSWWQHVKYWLRFHKHDIKDHSLLKYIQALECFEVRDSVRAE